MPTLHTNSDINIRLNLVDSFQLRYAEGLKTFRQLVNDFAKNSTVNARRDRAGADVSVLIVNAPGFCRPADMTSEPQPGDLRCCGLGDALMATADTAFSVVHQECVLAPNYSFAHEIGHLQGATHDKDGVLPAFQPYGHGFQHTSGRARWRTMMAYDCKPSCPRLPYWSNPRIKRGGVPMGTLDVNDNARVLNETAATVASFRNRPPARHPILHEGSFAHPAVRHRGRICIPKIEIPRSGLDGRARHLTCWRKCGNNGYLTASKDYKKLCRDCGVSSERRSRRPTAHGCHVRGRGGLQPPRRRRRGGDACPVEGALARDHRADARRAPRAPRSRGR
jgi:hypothetical protein